jgi:hypothetical protein
MAKQGGNGWMWLISGVAAIALINSTGKESAPANEAAPWLNDPVVYPAETVEPEAATEVGRDLLAAQPAYGDYLPDVAVTVKAAQDETDGSEDTAAAAPPLSALSLADSSEDDSLAEDGSGDSGTTLARKIETTPALQPVSSGASSLASASYDPPAPVRYGCAENGSCYGDISPATLRPKTVSVRGYFRKDGTYVRGHYRSRPR